MGEITPEELDQALLRADTLSKAGTTAMTDILEAQLAAGTEYEHIDALIDGLKVQHEALGKQIRALEIWTKSAIEKTTRTVLSILKMYLAAIDDEAKADAKSTRKVMENWAPGRKPDGSSSLAGASMIVSADLFSLLTSGFHYVYKQHETGGER